MDPAGTGPLGSPWSRPRLSNGTHLPGGTRLADDVRQLSERQAFMETVALLDDPLGPSDIRTPLGEPMDRSQAFMRAELPLPWHLQYWSNIDVVGVLRGEDEVFMKLMIEAEHENIPEEWIKTALLRDWHRFQIRNNEPNRRRWVRRTLEDEQAKKLLRDIDRMLADRYQKARSHLQRVETLMITSLRDGDNETAKMHFAKLSQCYQLLLEEERRDTEDTDNDEEMSAEDQSAEDG